MNGLSISDLFFIITGSAIVLISALIIIALLYLIYLLRTIKTVLHTAKRGAEIVSEDLSELRNNIKEKGVSISTILGFIKNMSLKQIFKNKKRK